MPAQLLVIPLFALVLFNNSSHILHTKKMSAIFISLCVMLAALGDVQQ
jgi:hypothetical protein